MRIWLDRRFLISNAQLTNKPIIYCNDAFCELTGHSRSDIIQKPSTCEFLYGSETSDKAIKQIRHALQGSDEKEVEIILYKTTGKKLDQLGRSNVFASQASNFVVRFWSHRWKMNHAISSCLFWNLRKIQIGIVNVGFVRIVFSRSLEWGQETNEHWSWQKVVIVFPSDNV